MGDADAVRADVLRDAAVPDFVRVAVERIGVSTRASAVFGDPVERDGVTVIPVAKTKWGFGGGSGGDAASNGAGGGGGSIVSPIGFIEVRDGDARFVRIRDIRATALRVGAAAGLVAWAVRRR
jgi:uncharacterized spore protein YtfJ